MRPAIFALACAAALLAAVQPRADTVLKIAADSAPSRATEPSTLRFGVPAPPTSFLVRKVFGPWVKAVNQDAHGAVHAQIFAGSALGDFRVIYDRTVAGVADIGFGIFGPIARQFPVTQVVSLPFEAQNSAESSVAMWRLYANGTLSGELSKVKPLGLFTFPNATIHLAKPISSVADLKGKKLSVSTRLIGNVIEQLGATPFAIQPTDTYQSISRGVIDGIVTSWNAVETFKLSEVTRYHLEAPLGMSPGFVVMNKGAYARLPAAARAVIDKHSGAVLSRELGLATDSDAEEAKRKVGAMAGQKLDDIPAKDLGTWQAAAKTIADKWIKATPGGAKALTAFEVELERIRAGK